MYEYQMEADQVVIKPAITRKLLRMGYIIKDVKPQRQMDGNIDYTRCVFVFKGKHGLNEAIKQFI